jgi:hypothetical protein
MLHGHHVVTYSVPRFTTTSALLFYGKLRKSVRETKCLRIFLSCVHTDVAIMNPLGRETNSFILRLPVFSSVQSLRGQASLTFVYLALAVHNMTDCESILLLLVSPTSHPINLARLRTIF